MHSILKFAKQTTYSKYRVLKSRLQSFGERNISSCCNKTKFIPMLECNHDAKNCHHQCLNNTNIGTNNSKSYISLSVRRCSRCTFVDGKIRDGIRTTPPWRILFFGTDQFAVFTLKKLNENRLLKTDSIVENLEVVSKKGETPVRSYSKEAGLLVHDWPIATSHDKYDVGVLVSFGHLVPARIIHQFPYGILNVHPSLLPRWRGASPIIHTILNGDTESGISVMEIRPKHFDIGPLLVQEKFAVNKNWTSTQLHDYLGPIGADILLKSLHNLPTLERLEFPQTEKDVTYAHKLGPNMAFIDWENQTIDSINCQYRAMHEIIPLRSQFGQYLVKLKDMVTDIQIDDSALRLRGIFNRSVPPGTSCYSKKQKVCWIRSKDGWVGFRTLTLKKTMSAEAFYNGYLQKPCHKDTMFTSHKNHLMENMLKEKLKAFS